LIEKGGDLLEDMRFGAVKCEANKEGSYIHKRTLSLGERRNKKGMENWIEKKRGSYQVGVGKQPGSQFQTLSYFSHTETAASEKAGRSVHIGDISPISTIPWKTYET
jgi:hypothetical protein